MALRPASSYRRPFCVDRRSVVRGRTSGFSEPPKPAHKVDLDAMPFKLPPHQRLAVPGKRRSSGSSRQSGEPRTVTVGETGDLAARVDASTRIHAASLEQLTPRQIEDGDDLVVWMPSPKELEKLKDELRFESGSGSQSASRRTRTSIGRPAGVCRTITSSPLWSFAAPGGSRAAELWNGLPMLVA